MVNGRLNKYNAVEIQLITVCEQPVYHLMCKEGKVVMIYGLKTLLATESALKPS